MSQIEKARAFADLHRKGSPLILYNIWDAGSAKTLAKAGAAALATGSWSVAAAQGYSDGETLPLDLLETIVARITTTVDLPVSVDFEGAYAAEPTRVGENVKRVIAAGAIGVNFEDRIVGGDGLYATEDQSARIAAMRQAAETAGVPLFINARTDLFLKERDRSEHAVLIPAAIERAAAYRAAGASGFFVPGLIEADLIAAVCEAADLPVNVMMMDGAPTIAELGARGVSRIGYGPGPYQLAMGRLAEEYRALSDAD